MDNKVLDDNIQDLAITQEDFSKVQLGWQNHTIVVKERIERDMDLTSNVIGGCAILALRTLAICRTEFNPVG